MASMALTGLKRVQHDAALGATYQEKVANNSITIPKQPKEIFSVRSFRYSFHLLLFWHCYRQTDRRTDGQTDGQTVSEIKLFNSLYFFLFASLEFLSGVRGQLAYNSGYISIMLKLFNSLHLKIFAFYETSTSTTTKNRNSCIGGI